MRERKKEKEDWRVQTKYVHISQKILSQSIQIFNFDTLITQFVSDLNTEWKSTISEYTMEKHNIWMQSGKAQYLNTEWKSTISEYRMEKHTIYLSCLVCVWRGREKTSAHTHVYLHVSLWNMAPKREASSCRLLVLLAHETSISKIMVRRSPYSTARPCRLSFSWWGCYGICPT